MSLEEIIFEYNSNKKYYDLLESNIKKSINGRICHHGVVILHIISKIMNIKKYLEIGVHNGTSMSYVVSSDLQIECYGIDLFESTIRQYLNDSLEMNRTILNIKNNNKRKSIIKLIKGNSFKKETIDELSNNIEIESVDLLFIDGDHSYNGVSSDFKNYEKFVKKGGIIVIDDYNIKKWPDVVKFCDSINEENFIKIGLFKNNEFILKKVK